MPLVRGRYPQSNPLWAVLGQPTNTANSVVPVRSNVEYLGITGLVDTAASLVTQIMTAVAIPVDIGQTITSLSFLAGATAAGTPTNSFAALYSGTTVAAPPLIAQTADGLTAPIAASARFDFTFATPQTITAAQAPFGFLWAAFMVKATTVPSLITVPVGAAAGQYAWFTNTPGGTSAAPGFALSSGSGLTTTAPATLIGAATKLVAPIAFAR